MEPLQLGQCVWSEDECTVHNADHQTLASAYRDLFDKPYYPAEALRTEDHGDCKYLLMPGEVIVVASYPGNNSIYRRKI